MVFEEEDFQLAMYGYRLNPDISEQRVIGMLREVETELNETIHSSSNASTVEVSMLLKFVPCLRFIVHFSSEPFQIEWASALNSRIRFTRLFYQLFMTLKKESVPVGDGIGECYNLLTTCMEILPSLLRTTYSTESNVGGASSSIECK